MKEKLPYLDKLQTPIADSRNSKRRKLKTGFSGDDAAFDDRER